MKVDNLAHKSQDKRVSLGNSASMQSLLSSSLTMNNTLESQLTIGQGNAQDMFQGGLTPILNLKFEKKGDNVDSVKIKNMRPVLDNAAVNLRAIILMDNEPSHFLQALQG